MGKAWSEISFRDCFARILYGTDDAFKLLKSKRRLEWNWSKIWENSPWECELSLLGGSCGYISPVDVLLNSNLLCVADCCAVKTVLVVLCSQFGVRGCWGQTELSVQQSSGHPEENGTVWCESGLFPACSPPPLAVSLIKPTFPCSCCSVWGSSLGRHLKLKQSGNSTKLELRKVSIKQLYPHRRYVWKWIRAF